jgi:methylamine---glutamate N-methyltransferase subunit B
VLPGPETVGGQEPPSVSIPEIRDYQKINAELVALLDQGHRLVRLEGAEGQRLLAAGLIGSWNAVVEIAGWTGPEVAANLDAPGLTIVAGGSTADGAGRGLRAGRVLIIGDAGDAVGYAQSGGILVVRGSAGHRAGLAQSGGTLAILGDIGRLAGDRQSGGRLFSPRGQLGPHAGRGRRGGRLIQGPHSVGFDPDDSRAWLEVGGFIAPWIAPSSMPQP